MGLHTGLALLVASGCPSARQQHHQRHRGFAASVSSDSQHGNPSGAAAWRINALSDDGSNAPSEGQQSRTHRPRRSPPPPRTLIRSPTSAPPTPLTSAGVRHYGPGLRRPPLGSGATKILSWNVAGLRALLRKDPEAIPTLIAAEKPDIICLQETKLQEKNIGEVEEALQLEALGYTAHWRCAVPPSRLGYSGVAVLLRDGLQVARVVPANVEEEADCEGRVLTAELEGIYVVCVYVPNSGAELKRLKFRTGQWDESFARYLRGLRAHKPVVLAGDLNVAHCEIDLHSPGTNLRSAGFTKEERESFGSNVLGAAGFVDTFREQHPGIVGYTYWSYQQSARARNKGWRIDYIMVTEELRDRCHDSFILPEIMGSDHCPVGLVLSNGTEPQEA